MKPTISVRRVFSSFLVFALLFLAALEQGHASTPPAPIGTVREIRGGTLERQENSQWKPLASGMVIFANDRVRTGPKGLAVLTLNEIGVIMIGPGTEYYLGHTTSDFKTLLKHGYLWISAKLSPGRTMSVATTNAVTGIRGTKFSVLQDAAGTDVCTCKGSVEVSLRSGKKMNVTSGMYGTVDASGKMEQPEKGKQHLEKIWKEKPARYETCLNCHRKGKKTGDLN